MTLKEIAEIMDSSRRFVLYTSFYGIEEFIKIYPEDLLGNGEPELLGREAVEISLTDGSVCVMAR